MAVSFLLKCANHMLTEPFGQCLVKEAFQTMVGVGTRICPRHQVAGRQTLRPPAQTADFNALARRNTHRSRRALLTHRAPAILVFPSILDNEYVPRPFISS